MATWIELRAGVRARLRGMVGAVGSRLVPMLYISNGNIPSRWAHTIQIMKMCESFGRLVPGFALLVPGDSSGFLRGNSRLFRRYGIRDKFCVLRLPMGWQLRQGALEQSNWRAFSKSARAYVRWLNPGVVVTRCHESADYALRDGLRVIFETHDGPGHPKTLRYISTFAEYPNLLGVVTTSEILKQAFAEEGVLSERILAVPNAADLDRYDTLDMDQGRARAALGFAESDYIAVYTGSLAAFKGIGTILESARLRPRIRFVVIGGEATDIRRWQAEATGLSNLQFTGFLLQDQLPRYLAAADVCLVPNSASDRTGSWTFSLKLYEYLAAQKPVVASDIPSLRCALNDGDGGILVPPDDAEALCESLDRLCMQPQLAADIAARGRCQVQALTWDDRARLVLETFAPQLLPKTDR